MRANCPEANGPDFDFGSSAILVELGKGRRALMPGQRSGVVYALDPDQQGAVLWQRRVGRGGPAGGVQWGSAADEKNAYVALSDVAMKPVNAGSARYGLGLRGAMGSENRRRPFRAEAGHPGDCLADTASGLWRPPGCSPAQSAAVTAIPGVVFSGGLDGHLRAYSAKDFKTANEVKAHGGALDGPGAVIVGGTLFVNSGYAFLGAAPGNVLLAFSVDGK